ncbi:MAG: quinolinate synthase NadA [SAR202 cluster bacterium]|nr:quinolinate synthase NadA [SAR202 cluster bacterium]
MATKTLRTPILPVTELEQAEFCRPTEDLEARPLAEEMGAHIRWQQIPTEYLHLNARQLDERIGAARKQLGKRAIILGHHYQREEVIKYADVTGDSFKLSQQAAAQREAEFIVFCGVHFMAETADTLAGPRQQVSLPNLTAGCSMADMAPTDDVLDCWDDLARLLGEDQVLPITYMNSTAAIKALCGRNGGIVCTSSNASQIMEWAFEQRPKVLFLPDEHLGRNTAARLGIPMEQAVLWNPFNRLGELTEEQIRDAKVILWRGHCSVHTRFKVAQVEAARERFPNVTVMVHPECPKETVDAADLNGSTEQIIKAVNESAPGSMWAIGTEINLVHRLAMRNPNKTIFCLDPVVCPCSTMYRTHPAYVAWVLEELVAGNVVNRIEVEPATKAEAKLALQRMLDVTAARTKGWDKA